MKTWRSCIQIGVMFVVILNKRLFFFVGGFKTFERAVFAEIFINFDGDVMLFFQVVVLLLKFLDGVRIVSISFLS